jgi:hypothetical protein
MKIKKLSKVEIILISFIAILILLIFADWKNFVARVNEGLETYIEKFEQNDTIK